MDIIKATAADAGCWISGDQGIYGVSTLVRIAQGRGMTLSPDDAAVVAAYESDAYSDLGAAVYEIADDAEAWLNANVAPEGMFFEWYDGEFFLVD